MKYLLIISILCILACGKSDQCERTEIGRITKVTVAKEIALGQTAAITLNFGIGNGCGSFKEIKSVQTGNTLNLEVLNAFKGCLCTELYQSGKEVFSFKPSQKGTYYIQYLLEENSLTTDTLLVK